VLSHSGQQKPFKVQRYIRIPVEADDKETTSTLVRDIGLQRQANFSFERDAILPNEMIYGRNGTLACPPSRLFGKSELKNCVLCSDSPSGLL
jgi:hypothetical protein